MEITIDKKFELTKDSIYCCGVTVYRIKALKDFGKVKAGDLGGFIEKESNLSQEGNCWIYNIAVVYDNAIVYGNAIIRDNAVVCGNAQVGDNADVYDKAIIYGNAKVYNSATVCGKALVCGNVEVNKEMEISSGTFTINTLEENIRCQTGLAPCNGEVIAYKRVSKDLNSLYDHKFKYVVGEWAEAKEPDMSDKSCASGLHFSNATYWDNQVQIHNTTLLIAKIRLEDIIAVQCGKIRCKRAFIMGTYDI